jgi:hypothetical protein
MPRSVRTSLRAFHSFSNPPLGQSLVGGPPARIPTNRGAAFRLCSECTWNAKGLPALGEDIEKLPWMTAATRKEANGETPGDRH